MKISYKYILKISTPIMVGSAVQNIIALTDQFFLGRVGMTETGAIGYVGVFYLILTAIGYGFSKGGQIMIARLMGERREEEIGKVTYGMLAFLMALGTFFFLFVKFFGPWFFRMTVTEDAVYQACLDFLDYRIYGIFFSYIGVSLLALYSGVARTTVIIYNAVALGMMNIFFNYCFVLGNCGFEPMGMAGSGLASTLSEMLALGIFLIYMFFDRKNLYLYGFFGRPVNSPLRRDDPAAEAPVGKKPSIFEILMDEFHYIIEQFKLSLPIVLQAAVGLGSWFIFFIVVERLGEQQLAISSVLRAVYLIFMIPSWGLSSGINTIASNLIGQKRYSEVMPTIGKTAILSFGITMGLSLLLVLMPEYLLVIGTDDAAVIAGAAKLIWILLVALALFSISCIYFNGLAGTGATVMGLNFQLICVAAYLAYVYFAVWRINSPLEVAWMSEFLYWILLFILCFWYLRTNKWQNVKIGSRPTAPSIDLHI